MTSLRDALIYAYQRFKHLLPFLAAAIPAYLMHLWVGPLGAIPTLLAVVGTWIYLEHKKQSRSKAVVPVDHSP